MTGQGGLPYEPLLTDGVYYVPMSIDLFDRPYYYPFIAVEGNKVKGYWEGGYANEFEVWYDGHVGQQGLGQSDAEAVMLLIIEWLNNKYFNQQFEADGFTSGMPTQPYISA